MKSIVNRFFSKIPEFDPQEEAFVNNPYPTYSHLRKTDPVFETKSGLWVLTKYKDVLAALTDERLGNSPSPYSIVHERNKGKYKAADVAQNILPFLDSPHHDPIRKNVILAYRESFKESQLNLEEIAIDFWQKALVQKGKEIEVIADFATPFSLSVMCKLIGLPLNDAKQLEKWCEDFFYLFMPISSQEVFNRLESSLNDFREYLRGQLRLKANSEAPDLLSKLKVVQSGGASLTEDQIIDNAMLLFADGIENVDKGIANALLCLLNHPAEWQRLLAQPDLVSSAAEECLRYESPAQYIGRIAKEDIELGGKVIQKNRAVLLVLGSANRDSQVFENPDRFQIHRQPNKHLSFGRAKHSCIGGGLVKQELVAVLKVVLTNSPNIQLPKQKHEWLLRPGHRWLKQLKVKVTT